MKEKLLTTACLAAIVLAVAHHTAELTHLHHQGVASPVAPADPNHPHAASSPAANTAVTVIGDTITHQEYEICWPTGIVQTLSMVVMPGRPTANS